LHPHNDITLVHYFGVRNVFHTQVVGPMPDASAHSPSSVSRRGSRGTRYFPGFEQLLEASQILPDLELWLLPEQLLHRGLDLPAECVEFQHELYFRAAVSRCVTKRHIAYDAELRRLVRTPSNVLVRVLAGDDRIPLVALPSRPFCHPMGPP